MAICRQSVAALALIAAVAGSGCSHSLSVQQQEPPPAKVKVLAVGAVIADDADHAREVRRFRRDLVARLRDTGAFEEILSPAPATLPAGAVLVTGHVHRIGDGSETLRFVLGSGAGAPRVRVRLEIHDAAGVRLAAFAQSARSFTGTGYAAHWNPIYLDDLVDDLAGRSADAIVRWRRGRPLDPAFWEDWL